MEKPVPSAMAGATAIKLALLLNGILFHYEPIQSLWILRIRKIFPKRGLVKNVNVFTKPCITYKGRLDQDNGFHHLLDERGVGRVMSLVNRVYSSLLNWSTNSIKLISASETSDILRCQLGQKINQTNPKAQSQLSNMPFSL